MTNFANLTELPRTEFIATIADEFNRAFEGITERGVSEYIFYAEDDGDFGVMAEPMRYPGFRFWNLTAEMVDGYTAEEYLGTWGEAMHTEYSNLLAAAQDA